MHFLSMQSHISVVIFYCGIDELLLRAVNFVQIRSSCCTCLTYLPPPSHCVMSTICTYILLPASPPCIFQPSHGPAIAFVNLYPQSLSMIFVGDHPYITQHIFGQVEPHPPTQLISINTVLKVRKKGHFLNPPSLFSDVI